VELILQSWAVGTTQHCALLTAARTKVWEIKLPNPTKPGTLRILVNGREAEVDHVLLFRH